jgi:hypothetical protein
MHWSARGVALSANIFAVFCQMPSLTSKEIANLQREETILHHPSSSPNTKSLGVNVMIIDFLAKQSGNFA